ncbi:hypothetical protein MRB53_014844 [Persea americana]|uniref:Uncharacterized protein n=1 Tax=Persea americana TaxID=3435 RepID=A0ACC2KCL1_PERAE|nr:hypothetical protein MRB53_014844 [Persea americana]
MAIKELSGYNSFHRFSTCLVPAGGIALFLAFVSWALFLNPLSPKVQVNFFSIDVSRKSESKLFALNINETVEPLPRQNCLNFEDPSAQNFPSDTIQAADQLVSPNASNDHNVARSDSNELIEQINQSFLGFYDDSRNVSSGAYEDNMVPSKSTMKKVDQDPSGEKFSSEAICEVDHANQSVPLNPRKPMEKLKQPFKGFSNDSRNVHSGGKDDITGPESSSSNEFCSKPTEKISQGFSNDYRNVNLGAHDDNMAPSNSTMTTPDQVETPENHGNRRLHRYIFNSASVTIIRVWSSWLVNKTLEPFHFAPEGVTKLHLDIPDENFMKLLPSFDVVVISGGHWFNKQSVYILNNQIVGGQFWWPDKTRKMKVDKVKAFAISTETTLSAIVSHPNYTGLTIVRSFSPNHYEGGAWNTGGSCTGRIRPALENELVENEYTNIMHQKQVTAFNNALKKATNKSKFRLMDITKIFGYRHDGHPGPYKSLNPNKVRVLGPHGEPPPQDCLHWCMPGAVDTWNELLLEIIRREFEGSL